MTSVYAVTAELAQFDHVAFALAQLRAVSDHLIVAAPEGFDVGARFHATAIDEVLTCDQGQNLSLAAMRCAWAKLARRLEDTDAVLFTTAEVLGPIGALSDLLERAAQSDAEVYCAYWNSADPSIAAQTDKQVNFDLAVLRGSVLQDRDVQNALIAPVPPDEAQLAYVEARVTSALLKSKRAIGYACCQGILKTEYPSLVECHRLIDAGSPVVPLSVLRVDPLLQDLNAMSVRVLLDDLRRDAPVLYNAALQFGLKHVPLRDFATISDDYAVFDTVTVAAGKTEWSFGTIAVFVHAYYTDMMDEIMARLEAIPARYKLFITVATAADQHDISAYLIERGLPRDMFELRVVAHNRGRDMSSLFITWRDVILSDAYELALRLHSKRTPQVAATVAESFKTHLFDNLLGSVGYVSNLLDRLEDEPNIGLVLPPMVHIGFITPGHSWFENKDMTQELARDMGIDVPFDAASPIAAYGTMYWFRTAALRPMFERHWRWEDYNAEPNHRDGGLAHAQERLIGYCAQAQGYRVLQAMTPSQAARNYARLEYKLQRLSAQLPAVNVLEQERYLSGKAQTPQRALHARLERIYGAVIRRAPVLHPLLRPLAKVATRTLGGKP